jgi:hypothetical protein
MFPKLEQAWRDQIDYNIGRLSREQLEIEQISP